MLRKTTWFESTHTASPKTITWHWIYFLSYNPQHLRKQNTGLHQNNQVLRRFWAAHLIEQSIVYTMDTRGKVRKKPRWLTMIWNGSNKKTQIDMVKQQTNIWKNKGGGEGLKIMWSYLFALTFFLAAVEQKKLKHACFWRRYWFKIAHKLRNNKTPKFVNVANGHLATWLKSWGVFEIVLPMTSLQMMTQINKMLKLTLKWMNLNKTK